VTKKVIMLSCILGLTSALPAHASPTNKEITISCSSVAPDVITGSVAVTLNDSAGNSFACGILACDSSGSIGPPPTNSASCTPRFRVHDMTYTLSYIDTDNSTNPAGSVSGTGIILKGSGFSTQAGPTIHPADTVTLDVK